MKIPIDNDAYNRIITAKTAARAEQESKGETPNANLSDAIRYMDKKEMK